MKNSVPQKMRVDFIKDADMHSYTFHIWKVVAHLNKLNTSLLSYILLHFAAQLLTHRCKTAGYWFSLSLKTDGCPLSVQERPEPAVSSQLLVPAAEPGEEGE